MNKLGANVTKSAMHQAVDRTILEGKSIVFFRAAIKSPATLDPYERRLCNFLSYAGMRCDQFAPSITHFGGRLYLFYHIQLGEFSEIIYRTGTVTGSGIEWSEGRTVPVLRGQAKSFPSAAPTADGLVLTYSYRKIAASPESDFEFFTSIGSAILKDGKWEDIGIVEVNMINDGFSKVVSDGKDVFVFFDQGKGTPDNPASFIRKIVYSRYEGNGEWQKPVTLADKKDMMASTAAHNGRMVLVYSELGKTFDLLQRTTGNQETEILDQTSEATQEVAKSLAVTSDKKSYEGGETAKFSGKLVMKSGSPEGKEIRLELSARFEVLGTALIESEKVTVGSGGSFEWEYKLPEGAGGVNYEIIASYKGLESSHQFRVE